MDDAESSQQHIITRLTEQDRVEGRYARMLPRNRKATETELADAANSIVSWMRTKKVSNSMLAKQLGEGFAASTISQVLNNTYNGDREAKLRSILDHIQRQREAESVIRPDRVVQTKAVRHMMACIKSAMRDREIAVIVGPAGFSKSTVMMAAHAITQGSVFVRATSRTRSPTGLLAAICGSFSIRHSRPHQAMIELLERLKDSDRPIFIDEAQLLRLASLDVIRDIHDVAGIPVIMSGAPELVQMVNDIDRGGQFYSRCSIYDIRDYVMPNAGGGSTGQIEVMHTIDEVLQICSADKLRFTGEAMELLFRLANLPSLGALRLCTRLVSKISQLRGIRDREVTSNDIWDTLQATKGDAYRRACANIVEQSHRTLKYETA